ncbi:MAG: valine--tRNA ligase, partial [Candidatus Nanopelagicales bacterium]
IHRSLRPSRDELAVAEGGNARILDITGQALSGVRKAKSDAKVSMKAAVSEATIEGNPADIEALSQSRADLAAAGSITELILVPAADDAPLSVRAILAPPA